MKKDNTSGKQLRFFDRLVRFVNWCDKRGAFQILVDIVLNIILWYLTNRR